MEFIRLTQYGQNEEKPCVLLEQISAVWNSQDDIDVTFQANDYAKVTMKYTGHEFSEMIENGGYVHVTRRHTRGWGYWLGLHGTDATGPKIRAKNNAAWIAEYRAMQERRIAA